MYLIITCQSEVSPLQRYAVCLRSLYFTVLCADVGMSAAPGMHPEFINGERADMLYIIYGGI